MQGGKRISDAAALFLDLCQSLNAQLQRLFAQTAFSLFSKPYLLSGPFLELTSSHR